jgi:2-polyprenyl-6-methoxyphenol hydroxylase-like FAD-dependent oxidoreductase
MLGRGRAFLLVPIGKGRLYWYADVNAREGRDPTAGTFHRFVELFGDFGPPAADVLGRLSPTDARYFSAIGEVAPRPWVKGCVVLIEDAAHATSPNMAQGTSMAMEDALVLAEMLASGQPVATCETVYATRRAPRVRWVQEPLGRSSQPVLTRTFAGSVYPTPTTRVGRKGSRWRSKSAQQAVTRDTTWFR